MRAHSSASTSAADTSGRSRRVTPGRAGIIVSLLIAGGIVAAGQDSQSPAAVMDRAVSDFFAAKIPESVAGFDRVAKMVPREAPELWQRGIALYYANRFDDCRAQFESHRTVNPADVENAAWHFLCVARRESPEKARAALLPVGPDDRVPMREIYRMFQGTMTPDSVLVAAGENPRARFYAALYVGLYFEAIGEGRARFYITRAASDEFAGAGGYMHRVAQVHARVRGWGEK
jgi:lipoprotein NlpI